MYFIMRMGVWDYPQIRSLKYNLSTSLRKDSEEI